MSDAAIVEFHSLGRKVSTSGVALQPVEDDWATAEWFGDELVDEYMLRDPWSFLTPVDAIQVSQACSSCWASIAENTPLYSSC